MKEIRIYPKLELLNTWAIDRTRFSPDATKPPLCLRCGQPLALSSPRMPSAGTRMSISATPVGQTRPCVMRLAFRSGLFSGAVENQRLKAPADDDAWLLKPLCSFDQIYLDATEDQMGRKSPRTELAYSRSDYDGRKWWTTWFTVHEGLKRRSGSRRLTSLWMPCLPCRRWLL